MYITSLSNSPVLDSIWSVCNKMARFAIMNIVTNTVTKYENAVNDLDLAQSKNNINEKQWIVSLVNKLCVFTIFLYIYSSSLAYNVILKTVSSQTTVFLIYLWCNCSIALCDIAQKIAIRAAIYYNHQPSYINNQSFKIKN